jgi:glycosyltransferase involved in cell wall biosynthesis
MSENISIVHKNGDELHELYKKADIAMLYVKPQEYREFAAPVKLYEYIGEGKPIIASKGTLAGSFVLENDVGWSVEYTKEACTDLLNFLQTYSVELKIKQENIQKIALKHTWRARAMQVAEDLTK